MAPRSCSARRQARQGWDYRTPAGCRPDARERFPRAPVREFSGRRPPLTTCHQTASAGSPVAAIRFARSVRRADSKGALALSVPTAASAVAHRVQRVQWVQWALQVPWARAPSPSLRPAHHQSAPAKATRLRQIRSRATRHNYRCLPPRVQLSPGSLHNSLRGSNARESQSGCHVRERFSAAQTTTFAPASLPAAVSDPLAPPLRAAAYPLAPIPVRAVR